MPRMACLRVSPQGAMRSLDIMVICLRGFLDSGSHLPMSLIRAVCGISACMLTSQLASDLSSAAHAD